jgi:EpsI family protein
MSPLNSTPARVLAVVLMLQAASYYVAASRAEIIPDIAPLAGFPPAVREWTLTPEMPLEKEVIDILRADDTLNRIYRNPQGIEASLFIAFFKTQRYGQSPHSPRNCLPVNGWQRNEDSRLTIAVPGREAPITINNYVIARGDEGERGALLVSEPQPRHRQRTLPKMWLIADAIRYHRSDTALVRVIVPVRDHARDTAEQAAAEFAPHIRKWSPTFRAKPK